MKYLNYTRKFLTAAKNKGIHCLRSSLIKLLSTLQPDALGYVTNSSFVIFRYRSSTAFEGRERSVSQIASPSHIFIDSFIFSSI
jgi:hypothetical protein